MNNVDAPDFKCGDRRDIGRSIDGVDLTIVAGTYGFFFFFPFLFCLFGCGADLTAGFDFYFILFLRKFLFLFLFFRIVVVSSLTYVKE